MLDKLTYLNSWNQNEINFVITLIAATLGFIFYWFSSKSKYLKTNIFNRYIQDKAWVYYVFYQKILGLIFLGIIPSALVFWLTPFKPSDLGLNSNNFKTSVVFISIIITLVLIIMYFATKNKSHQEQYPEMRIRNWTIKHFIFNSVSWALYLFGYEFLMRGLLLMVCFYSLGFWPAIAINLCLYSFMHIPKGFNETISAIPFGIVLCVVTIATGSILTAYVAHLVLALCNDFYSFYHNPEMRFDKN